MVTHEIQIGKIPAILVTYNPSSDLWDKLVQFSSTFERIIIVDNGSNINTMDIIEQYVQSMGDKLLVIINKKNMGVAKALNQGLMLASQLGYHYAVSMDQDSRPVPGMLESLVQTMLSHPNRENLAILAPDIIEESSYKTSRYLCFKSRFSFKRMTCQNGILRNVTFVITSGSLYNLRLYLKIGPFRDDFFIDAVDKEYCLRAISKGYEISVACNAKLEHNLGHRDRRQLLVWASSPTFHPSFRWYYMNRNRIAMFRMYAWQYPHWFVHEMGVALKGLARMLVFENQRIKKIKATLYGLRDGFFNRMGEMPSDVKQVLNIIE